MPVSVFVELYKGVVSVLLGAKICTEGTKTDVENQKIISLYIFS